MTDPNETSDCPLAPPLNADKVPAPPAVSSSFGEEYGDAGPA